MSYLQFLAQLQRWAVRENQKSLRVRKWTRCSHEKSKDELWSCRSYDFKSKHEHTESKKHLLTSKVTLPSCWLSAAMSKYTVGFFLAAAGPLLHMRATVTAAEQNFILFDKSNILSQSMRDHAAHADRPKSRFTCERGWEVRKFVTQQPDVISIPPHGGGLNLARWNAFILKLFLKKFYYSYLLYLFYSLFVLAC